MTLASRDVSLASKVMISSNYLGVLLVLVYSIIYIFMRNEWSCDMVIACCSIAIASTNRYIYNIN